MPLVFNKSLILDKVSAKIISRSGSSLEFQVVTAASLSTSSPTLILLSGLLFLLPKIFSEMMSCSLRVALNWPIFEKDKIHAFLVRFYDLHRIIEEEKGYYMYTLQK